MPQAACDGDIRAILSLRRLSADPDSVLGLRPVLIDHAGIASASETFFKAQPRAVRSAQRWFEVLAGRGSPWGAYMLGGLLGVGIPGIMEANLEVGQVLHPNSTACSRRGS